MDNNSLSHTKWNCKYHIVFAPKFRRKIIYRELREDIANILSMLCKRKEVYIVEAEIYPDYVHVLSNIMLNELDKELERRGHRFVRYTDDCMIFCICNIKYPAKLFMT